MDDEKLELLRKAGVDVEDAMGRFMNNGALYERFLRKFIDEQNFSKMVEALKEEETEEAFCRAHALKGVCANLSMTPLYLAMSEQTELLRAGNLSAAQENLPSVKEVYDKMQDVLKMI